SAILHETPPRPSKHRVVSAPLETVCMKSLSKEPAQRYQSAGELLEALKGVEEQHDAVTQRASHLTPSPIRNRKRKWIVPAVVVTALPLGLLTLRIDRSAVEKSSLQSRTNPFLVRRSVAVLGFKNLSQRSDVNWLSAALSEMLTTELAAGEEL